MADDNITNNPPPAVPASSDITDRPTHKPELLHSPAATGGKGKLQPTEFSPKLVLATVALQAAIGLFVGLFVFLFMLLTGSEPASARGWGVIAAAVALLGSHAMARQWFIRAHQTETEGEEKFSPRNFLLRLLLEVGILLGVLAAVLVLCFAFGIRVGAVSP